jgi:hypothetical protein
LQSAEKTLKQYPRRRKMKKKILIPCIVLILLIQSAAIAALPDTGQTQCYNNEEEISCPLPGEDFYGQDAHYDINPQSYTKLDAQGNALSDDEAEWVMVRDNVTGLVWEVKTDDGSVHDKDNRYTWYDSNSQTNGGNEGSPGDGTDTEDFINALNSESFGGFSDWRLPTIRELSSIENIGRNNPVIDTEYFVNTPDSVLLDTYTTLICYWSSTTNANAPAQAWFTMFAGGSNDYYYRDSDKSKSLYVRAVRGGQEWKTNHFTDNGDGTITDSNTGLMWQKLTFDSKMIWKNALASCENLSLAGYDDWRLPNIGELRSVLDYTKHAPASDATYFPDVKNDNYWASNTDLYDLKNAWYVSFSDAIDGSEAKSLSHYVRAVRGGFPKAGISGTPDSPTDQRDASLTINGDNIVSYQYKLDDGYYSEEIPVSEPISLTDLQTGTHTVYVLGKNNYGTWQIEDNPTIASWTVSTLFIAITNPSDGISVDELTNIKKIEGTASVKTGNVSKVEIQIRDEEGDYLDSQKNFVETETWLLADGTESWSFNISSVNWGELNYTITARNTGSAGDVITDSVTVLVCQPSEITCEMPSESARIGEKITISGQISPSPTEAGKGVSIEFTSPSGEKINKSANANIEGEFDYSLECDQIQTAGTWKVQTSWAGDGRLCGDASELYSLTVSKAPGSIWIDTDFSVIKLGESVFVSGRFEPVIKCEMDFSDIPIALNISGPNNRSDNQTVYTSEGGLFLIEDYAGFDALGEWTVTAVLEENDLAEDKPDSVISEIQITVRETAGYAIIIQGYNENDEELKSYNKTTQFVYSTMMKDRKILDEDIKYLNYDETQTGVDDISSKTKIEDAITQWAADKMNEKPANLYIVMVNHGDKSGNFYLHNFEMIAPVELGEWLDALRNNLTTYGAKEQEIVVIMGFCYSGSFIGELSGDNRVIIASSGSGEPSIKGPEGEDGIPDGDYFTAEFFGEVSSGKSVATCFQETVENLDSFFTQQPLLDDNGDGKGSSDLSPVDADGSNSSDIYIGTGISDVNAIDDVSIIEVAPAIFLDADENSTDKIWARIRNSNRLKNIWIQIKKPNSEIIGLDGTGQVEISLEGAFFSETKDADGKYQWDIEDVFSEPGTYQIFYSAKDNTSANESSLMETRLYKAKTGNRPPSDPSLLSPENGEGIATDTYLQVKLDWTDAQDPEGNDFSYTLILSQNSDFSDAIYKEDLECSICLISEFDDMKTGYYYWKVRAIDEYGAYGESEVGEFNVSDTNPLSMWVGGRVIDISTNLPINDVLINVIGSLSSFSFGTDAAGCYLEELSENDTISVKATGYSDPEPWTVSPKSNEKRKSRTEDLMLIKNFELSFSCDTLIRGDILKDCKVDVKDAVFTLKILSGQADTVSPHTEASLNGEEIRLQDAVSILRTISGVK